MTNKPDPSRAGSARRFRNRPGGMRIAALGGTGAAYNLAAVIVLLHRAVNEALGIESRSRRELKTEELERVEPQAYLSSDPLRIRVVGKGDKPRTVTLPPETVVVLRQYLQNRPQKRLGKPTSGGRPIVRSDGRPCTRSVIDNFGPPLVPPSRPHPTEGCIGAQPDAHLCHTADREARSNLQLNWSSQHSLVEQSGTRGLMNILDTWGGETLGWLREGRGSSFASQHLTEASEPAIVEFAARVPTLNTHTPLLPAFAGASEKVSGSYWHQWRTSESIPPEFVLDVLTIRSNRWPPALDEYRS